MAASLQASSRSEARWLGFSREAATRLSFLMSLPIIAGAGVYKGAEVVRDGGIPSGFLPIGSALARVLARSRDSPLLLDEPADHRRRGRLQGRRGRPRWRHPFRLR